MGNGSWQLEMTRPWALALLVAVPPMVYYSRRSLVHFARWQRNLSLAVRVLLVVVLVIALCGIGITSRCDQEFVVFAVDVSNSVPGKSRGVVKQFIHEAVRQLGERRVKVLEFSSEPEDNDHADRNVTDIARAIAAVRADIPATFVPKLVLFSDGNQTTGDALAAAKAAGCPIATVPLPGRPKDEVFVSAVATKDQVREGEPFRVDVVIQSTGKNRGTVKLSRGSQPVDEKQVQLRPGENRVRFRQAVTGQSLVTFMAKLEGFKDTHAENNEAGGAVFIAARPRVLLIESRPALAKHLAAALSGEYINVEVRSPDEMPESLEDMQDYELLILSNVPAEALPKQQMQLIRRYVHDFGGGLIAIGGDRAFTPGGYRNTTLEQVLPVVCEPKKDKPKPRLAMVLVIDRSGSMEEGNAIELAKQAARQAVAALGPRDRLGIIGFEDSSRWISEIHPCSDKQHVLDRINTITAGGGTNMYPAMEKAYLALSETFADLKHMIVLSDGLSHPGDFDSLARTIAASGITVSTVAVGQQAARQVLEDIARRGGGNFYYCADPAAVPQVFAQETISAGKVGITEEPFFPQVVNPADALADLDLRHAPALLGFVETRLKPAAELILAGEQGDPLLAWWRYGHGTSAAFTSDVQSRWAAAWLRWPGFGRFWAQLVRHAMRKDPSRDFTLAVERCGLVVGYPDELRVRPTNVELLKSIAETTGGVYAPEPAEVFAASDRTVPRTTRLWPYLMVAVVLIFVIDLAAKRIELSRCSVGERRKGSPTTPSRLLHHHKNTKGRKCEMAAEHA